MNLRKYFFVGILCWLGLHVSAQEYTLEIQELGVEEGLSSRGVIQVFQDRFGYIWIETAYGFDRYDGFRLENYSNQDYDLFTDFNQNVWLKYDRVSKAGETKPAIGIFDSGNGQLISLEEYTRAQLPFEPHQVTSLFYETNGNILVGTLFGAVYEINAGRASLRYDAGKGTRVHKVFRVDSTNVWVNLDHKEIRLNDNWEIDKEITSRPDFLYDSLTRNSSLPFDLGHAQKKPKGFERAEILAVVSESALQFWRTTNDIEENYLILSDSDGNVLATLPYTHRFNLKAFLDRQNNLWLAAENGVHIVSFKKLFFKKYIEDKTLMFGTTYGARGILELDKDSLFVNGLGRSWILGPNSQNAAGYAWNEEGVATGVLYQRLAVVEKEDLLFVTGESWLFHTYNLKTGEVTVPKYDHLDSNPSAITNPILWTLHIARNGVLWAGGIHGLAYLDKSTETLKFLGTSDKMAALSQTTIFDIYENESGLWLATTNGIYLFDPKEQTILEHYNRQTQGANYLPTNSFLHIYEDDNGTFWLASKGGGLIEWHPETGEYRQFTTLNGLSHDVVYAVYEDNHQNLWLPSDLGINQFNKITHEVTVYTESDGLSHNEFNTISHHRGRDSTLYFGGQNGINAFNPDEIVENQRKEETALVLSRLQKQKRKDGVYTDLTSQYFSDGLISIYPDDLGFQFSFGHLDYKPKDDRLYAYQIECMDAGWNYIRSPEVRINLLPYGKHELSLKAQQANGKWSEVKKFPIMVYKPLYLRPWFITLMAAVTIVAIYLLFHFRIRGLRKREEMLERVVERRTAETKAQAAKLEKQAEELMKLDAAKSQFFANISHELRTPLTLIMGPIRELIKDEGPTENRLKQLQTMYRNGHNLSNLVEEILELSKLEAGKLEVNPKPVLLKPFLNRLYQAFESLAVRKGITYSSDFPIFDQTALFLDANMLEKVINNLLSNAIKFTGNDGSVKFHAHLDGDSLKLVVEDSGQGIATKDIPHIFDRFYQGQVKSMSQIQGGTGIGLALAKELTEAMDGSIKVDSVIGEGSYFEVTLPKKEAELSDLPYEDQEDELILSNPVIEHIESSDNESEFKILLVEDHPDMQDHIHSLLKSEYNVSLANNGNEALDILKSQPVDLIVTDIMMPEMDGFTLLRILKANDLYRSMPVIVLTARAEAEDKLDALTIGVDDYLTKPFLAEELQARVKNLLNNAIARKHVAKSTDQSSESDSELITSIDVKVSSQAEMDWIKQIETEALSRLTDYDFSIELLAETQNISVRQLQRKIKDITGLKPNQYVQELRFRLSRSYLEKKAYGSITEVSRAVGFQSTKYFSRQFKERFGKNPSEYLS